MRKRLFIWTILILIFSQMTYGQIFKVDTIFIRKDSLEGASQSVFFEENINSKFYEDLTSFKFSRLDQGSYDNSLRFLKKIKLNLTKNEPVISAAKWITLKQYKGKFYAYYPCDFYADYRVSINDTTYIDWSGEGPIANKIITQNKINQNTFKLKLAGQSNLNRQLTIHILDIKKGIAVFEKLINDKDKNYYLMIMANKVKSVPFIVNNCENQKQSELEFEQPNFEKLLKSKKIKIAKIF